MTSHDVTWRHARWHDTTQHHIAHHDITQRQTHSSVKTEHEHEHWNITYNTVISERREVSFSVGPSERASWSGPGHAVRHGQADSMNLALEAREQRRRSDCFWRAG